MAQPFHWHLCNQPSHKGEKHTEAIPCVWGWLWKWTITKTHLCFPTIIIPLGCKPLLHCPMPSSYPHYATRSPARPVRKFTAKNWGCTWGRQNPLITLGALAKIRRPICRECWASAWQKIKSQKVSEMLNNGLQLFHISHHEKILARDDSEVFHSYSGHCGKCDKEQAFSLLLSGLLKTVINCCLW